MLAPCLRDGLSERGGERIVLIVNIGNCVSGRVVLVLFDLKSWLKFHWWGGVSCSSVERYLYIGVGYCDFS